MRENHVGLIIVSGTPVAQPRPRAHLGADGQVGVHDNGKSRAWKDTIIAEAMRNRLPRGLTVPVRLRVFFLMPRPKSLGNNGMERPHRNVPDLDNLLKAVMDALSEYGAWRDDRQVASIFAEKWYAPAGVDPSAIVAIELMEQ